MGWSPVAVIPLLLLSTATCPCTSTPTAHRSFSFPPPKSCHHLVPHTGISKFFFISCTTRNWRNANISSCRTSRGMWDNTFEFAGKDKNEIVSCRYSFLNFFIQIWICTLFFGIFLGRFLTSCMKTYYTTIIVYHLNFLGKSFQWLWVYCFSHSYYKYLLSFFWVSQTKNHLNVKRP